jgi:glutamyl-tRNA(Gln) amidotransferase subunit E
VSFQFLSDGSFRKLGFRCGLEVHQQLLTGKKLFCRCPARLYSKHYDAEVLRHMRPTLSEMGEYDGTALMEFKTKKDVIYRLNSASVCTYEMDDAPPFELNEQALDVALELALMLGCSLVGEIHIIRKQYLDGSIPAGFQRTAIVGVDGGIPFRGRTIGIRQLAVEEDACREVSDCGHIMTFRTDRLSIPLSETVTEPQICTPEEAVAVGWEIARLARVTGKVRRGAGAARQDVNVSIEDSTRVEIKGVSRIPLIEQLVLVEAHRHKALLDIRDELRTRGITPDSVREAGHRVVPVTDLFRRLGGDNRITAELLENSGTGIDVRAVRLDGFKGILSWPTQPGTCFADELGGRVRVIACLDRMPNLFHSELREGEAAGVPDRLIWDEVRRECFAGADDAVVLVWGPVRDTDTAAQEILIRAAEAAEGVPSETRQPKPGGLTDFERILPGPDRMYPDTDMPPKAIDDERIARITAGLKSKPWEREETFAARGMPAPAAHALAVSPRGALAEKTLARLDLDPRLVATTLLEKLKHAARLTGRADSITDDDLFELFRLLAGKQLFPEALRPLLPLLAEIVDAGDGDGALGLAFQGLGLDPDQPLPDLETEVDRAIAHCKGTVFASPANRHRHAMGILMSRVGGRIPGQQAAELLAEKLGL